MIFISPWSWLRSDSLAPSLLCLDCTQKLLARYQWCCRAVNGLYCRKPREKGAQAVRQASASLSGLALFLTQCRGRVILWLVYGLSKQCALKDASVFQMHHKALSLTSFHTSKDRSSHFTYQWYRWTDKGQFSSNAPGEKVNVWRHFLLLLKIRLLFCTQHICLVTFNAMTKCF